MIKVSFTGHRKLGNSWDQDSPAHLFVRKELKKVLQKLLLTDKNIRAYSGMALGFDTIACQVCKDLGIPYVAVKPFEGQELKWNYQAQETYKALCKEAKEVVVVSEGNYSPDKMFLRDEYLVDVGDILIAAWDGRNTGGTHHTIQYAKTQDKIIIHINPNDYNDKSSK